MPTEKQKMQTSGNERIIKRYQNRKLYDTYQSCYVTLEEIAQLIREENNIKFVCNKYKTDISYQVYLQVLFNQERKLSGDDLDINLLTEVIRSNSATFTGYIKEHI